MPKSKLSTRAILKILNTNRTEILFSFFFSMIFTFGFILSNYYQVDVTPISKASIVGFFFGFNVIWAVFYVFLSAIKQLGLKKQKETRSLFLENFSDRKLWLLISCAIFICYIPIVFLLLSVLTPDSWGSINQTTGTEALRNTHPIIFTLFVGVFIRIGVFFGSLGFGLVLFSLVQSAILAMIFAQVIVWMRRQGVDKFGILAAFIFYAIFPINSVAGVILWKDILFAGFGLLLLIVLRELYINGDKFFTRRRILKFIVLAFLFCAWRNNGIYAYTLFAFLAVLVNYKTFFKPKYLKLLLSPIFLFISYSVLTSLISSPTTQAEALSVPLQQIARTVKYRGETISETDRRIIEEILPLNQLGEKYNPNLSDPVKSSFNEAAFKEDKVKYFKLWFGLLLEHKRTYVAAFIYNSYGYIYPFYNSSTTTDIITDNASHYNTPDDYSDSAYTIGTKQVVIGYRDLTSSIFPLLRNVGFYVCIMLFSIYIAIIRRKKELVGVFILLFSLFLTTVLGPVNGEFRYLYLFVVATPFILGAVLSDPIRIKSKENRGKN